MWIQNSSVNNINFLLQGNSIFGSVDDHFFRAQAALAEMDIKNVNVSAASMLRPQDMFS